MFPTLLFHAYRTARLAVALACLGACASGHAAAQDVPQARAASASAQDGDSQRAFQAVASATHGYLTARDYKGLETLYARVKGPGQRTPDGLWQQAPFYNLLRE